MLTRLDLSKQLPYVGLVHLRSHARYWAEHIIMSSPVVVTIQRQTVGVLIGLPHLDHLLSLIPLDAGAILSPDLRVLKLSKLDQNACDSPPHFVGTDGLDRIGMLVSEEQFLRIVSDSAAVVGADWCLPIRSAAMRLALRQR
jgi:hypothetical protein